MDNLLNNQLKLVKNFNHSVDGVITDNIPDNFNEIVFFKKSGRESNSTSNLLKFEFKNYIVNPYKGFDFHDKFNNGIAPPEENCVGIVLKETEKMVYVSVSGATTAIRWVGWCPKKSVNILY